jgi:hypothetical protein
MLDVEVDLVCNLGALLRLGGLGEEDEGESQDQQHADRKALEVGHGVALGVVFAKPARNTKA